MENLNPKKEEVKGETGRDRRLLDVKNRINLIPLDGVAVITPGASEEDEFEEKPTAFKNDNRQSVVSGESLNEPDTQISNVSDWKGNKNLLPIPGANQS